MEKKIAWIFVFFLAILPEVIHAQDQLIPKDSLGFRDFLKRQKEIPGLSFRFLLTDKSISDSIASDSVYHFSKTDSGFVSGIFNDFSRIDELETPFIQDSLGYQFLFDVYSNTYSPAAANEYVSNLVRNGDYQVKQNDGESIADLVGLASKTPYTPLQKFKLRFFSDYQLFGVTVVIVFFFIVSLSMITFMLVMKVKKSKRESLLKEYEQLIIDPLTSLLFEKELQEIQEMDIKELQAYFPEALLSKRLFKDVLIERIIGLNKKMKGEFKEKLKALYKKLELDIISINSLSDKKWDRVTMGLVQINEMDLVEALPEVKKFVQSPNFHIRSQAVATLLNLSEKMDLVFLRDLAFPLSLWQQMNYLRIIKFVSHQKTLKLEVLFDSQNQSVRLFGYKLVRMLGRVDLIEILARSANEVSDEEKIEILETYATLGAHMEVGFINDCLQSQNSSLSLSAAKAASVIGDSESADILADLIKSEHSFSAKYTYLKSLFDLDKEKFELTTLANPSKEILEIKEHIQDPMLHHV